MKSISKFKQTFTPVLAGIMMTTILAGDSFAEEHQDAQQPKWQYARFSIAWDGKSSPSWEIDPLIANEVLVGIIRDNKDKLKSWRFHRRAAQDSAGHRFSFISFADDETNNKIRDNIIKHPVIAVLKQRGILSDISFAPSSTNPSDLADTSDKRWDTKLQSAWTSFIQGSSETWIGMISACLSRPEGDNVADLIPSYGKANSCVGEIWKNQGEHAFLHHLNAIFGYEEIVVTDRKARRF